jgi:hypothetical protein
MFTLDAVEVFRKGTRSRRPVHGVLGFRSRHAACPASLVSASATADEAVRDYLKEKVLCSPNVCDAACVCRIVRAKDHVSCQNDLESSAVGWCYVDAAYHLGNAALVGGEHDTLEIVVKGRE